MGAIDDKTANIADDVIVDSASESTHIGSGFAIFLFIIGLVFSMIIGWVIFPKLLYSQKYQPFNFNHSLHMEEVSDGCDSCHFVRSDGSFSGIPKLELCVGCHDDLIGESENEIFFVDEYVRKGNEVPWLIYSKQPDCVFFSHVAHINGANLECAVCHGHMEKSEKCKVYEYNIITGYSKNIWGPSIAGFKKNSWDRMKMDDCAGCHSKVINAHNSSVQTGRDACFVCHK